MDNLDIAINSDGSTTRTFKPVSDKNNVVTFETRDQDRRSLESSLTLASTRLESQATKVASKLIYPVVRTVDTIPTSVGQNMVKLDVIISDEASSTDRAELSYALKDLVTQLHTYIADLEPVLA